jgi:hypothetical protein
LIELGLRKCHLEQMLHRCSASSFVLNVRAIEVFLTILTMTACGKSNNDTPDKLDTKAALSTGSSSAAPAIAPPPSTPAVPAAPLTPLAKDSGKTSGKTLWARSLGGFGSDVPRAIAVTATDEAIVVGNFEMLSNLAARDGAPNASPIVDERKSHGDSDGYVTKFAATGDQLWTLTLGGTQGDSANAVAARDGDMLVAGNFSFDLTTERPGSTRPGVKATSAGSDDVFAMLIDGAGDPKWIFTAGGRDSDGANAVAATPDGGWIVGGSFSAKATFGDTTLNSAGLTDAMLLKLDNVGKLVWVKQFGGLFADSISHLAVDVQGNIVLQGVFATEVSWGGAKLKAAGGSDADIVLAKFDANGNHLWSQRFGDQWNEVAGGVAVDQAGNITMTGSYDRSITFGTKQHLCAGESDIFVARFGPDGALQWSKSFGGQREDIGFGIATDDAGNIIMSGWFMNKLKVDATELISKGNKDALVIKLDSTGIVRWANSYGNRDHDQVRAMTIDHHGNPIIAGVFRFNLDVGTAQLPLVSTFVAGDRAPRSDIFVAKLDK